MNFTIPIFQLKLVLFPGSSYALHIYEPRYIKMIRYCQENSCGFGIVSVIADESSKVGSYVEIEKTLKKYRDGAIDITVKAHFRFTILSTLLNKDGYTEAKIELYNDANSESDRQLFNLIYQKFISILNKANIDLEYSYWDNLETSSIKSFKLAEKSGLTIQQQQVLLAMKSEKKRLTYLNEHFDKIDRFINETRVMKDIILNDGYLN